MIKLPLLLWERGRKRGSCLLVSSRRRTTEKPEEETRGGAQRKLRTHRALTSFHALPFLSLMLPPRHYTLTCNNLGLWNFFGRNFKKPRFSSKLENTAYTCGNYDTQFSSAFSHFLFFCLFKREPELGFGLCFQPLG